MRESKKLKFNMEGDHWGYRWIGDCWLVENRDGGMLIGDGLPSDEKVVRQYCRCANLAHDDAMAWARKKLGQALSDFEHAVDKTLKR